MAYRNDIEAARHREALLRDTLADEERDLDASRASVSAAEQELAREIRACFPPWPARLRGALRGALKPVALVALFGGIPAASCVVPFAFEACRDDDEAVRRELARKDEARFTHLVELRWLGKVGRSEGAYFAPETPCEVSAKLRGDGGERLRGTVAVKCGKILLHEEVVDQIRCQVEEERSGDGAFRYRMRCLSPASDGVHALDVDTKRNLCEIIDTERKSDVLVTTNETSEPRRGASFR